MRSSRGPTLFRRSVALSSLSLALTAGLLAVAGPSCGGIVVVGECSEGKTVCDDACVDLDSDLEHCGRCGYSCGEGFACQEGACVPEACPPGLTDCGGFCADTLSDPAHCGGCFLSCVGSSCVNGVCQSDACPPGLTDCFGTCTDIDWDPFNCGGCGIACEPSQSCILGACEGQPCQPGFVDCGGTCVDLASSPQHCGGCFLPCGPDEVCTGGTCAGCFGQTLCGVCNYQDVGLPPSISGDTTGAVDSYTPTCVPGGAGEAAFLVTATAGGLYTFDTAGSVHDTALAVVDPATCAELACNDDANGTGQSEIALSLGAGQQVLVIVDGFAGSMGAYTLNIEAPIVVACEDGDLGSQVPQVFTGSTVGGGDDSTPTCIGAPGGLDRAYTFTAPFSGTFSFNTFGSNFDTVLYLLGGCGGPTLACNDDTMGLQSSVSVPLTAGQQVVVVVDGFGGSTGNFTLNIGG